MAHASSLSKGTSDADSLQEHVHLVARIQSETEKVWVRQKVSNNPKEEEDSVVIEY